MKFFSYLMICLLLCLHGCDSGSKSSAESPPGPSATPSPSAGPAVPDPEASAASGPATKLVRLDFDVPRILLLPHQVQLGLDLGNAMNLGRIYVDGEDVGHFEFYEPSEISVPATGRSFQLRQVGNAGLSTSAHTNEVDISQFPAGSKINVHCVFRINWSGTGNCSASLAVE